LHILRYFYPMDNPIPQCFKKQLLLDSFGMITFGRSWEVGSDEGYRFGFNGKENTNEIIGDNIAIDFGARIYDARLGIWFSIDLDFAKYPSYSPYAFSMNSPLYYRDADGKGGVITIIEEPGKAPYIMVTTNINIYNDALGTGGTNELATIALQIENDIETAFNNPYVFDAATGTFTQTKATAQYKGATVDVVFNVVVNIVTDATAEEAIAKMNSAVEQQNKNIDGPAPKPAVRIDVSQNYIKIDHGTAGSSMAGGNSGEWYIEQNNESGGTVWLEEYAHMLGWAEKELPYKGRMANGNTGLVQDPIHANPDETHLGYPFSIMSNPFLDETGNKDNSFIKEGRVVLTSDIDHLNGGSGVGTENESPTLNNSKWKRNTKGQLERIIGPATTTY
jgi:RHS repeat-associated protein